MCTIPGAGFIPACDMIAEPGLFKQDSTGELTVFPSRLRQEFFKDSPVGIDNMPVFRIFTGGSSKKAGKKLFAGPAGEKNAPYSLYSVRAHTVRP